MDGFGMIILVLAKNVQIVTIHNYIIIHRGLHVDWLQKQCNRSERLFPTFSIIRSSQSYRINPLTANQQRN